MKSEHGNLSIRHMIRKGSICFVLFMLMSISALLFSGKVQAALSEHHLRPYSHYVINLYDGDAEKTFTMMSSTFTYGFTKTGYDAAYALYNLDKKVSSVSFTVGHLDGKNKEGSQMKVYLDDIYQEAYSMKLTGDMMNQFITIPTTGVRKLEISLTASNGDYGIANIVQTSAHQYTSKVTKTATAKEAGIRQYTCTDCGSTYTESIPARTYCEPYLFPYQKSVLTQYDEEEGSSKFFTVMGEKYYKGLVKTGYDKSTALYNLNAEYNSVTFTVGHIDNANREQPTLTYYADGIEMDAIKLAWNMTDQVIQIDNLSSVRQLKIEINASNGDYAIFNMTGDRKDKTQKAHTYEEQVTMQAQLGVEGIMTYKCKDCGAYYTAAIPALKSSLKDSQVKLDKEKFTYNGKAQIPAVTVTCSGTVLVKDTDYKVTWSNNTNAGTASVTVTGIGNYEDSAEATFTIAKAAQPMTVKVKTAAVKYSKVKSKKQTVKKAAVFTIKKNQGKVTFKKVSAPKGFSIGKTNGNITVPKKTKKGTYKLKIQVTAAGNKNYEKGSKVVTVKVKVK